MQGIFSFWLFMALAGVRQRHDRCGRTAGAACGLDDRVGVGVSAPACGGVELSHELAVGCPGCGELVAAFFELEPEVGGLLLEVGDLLAEGVDVGGCAEPGFASCLFAERIRQPLFELPDAGAEAARAFVSGEQVGLQ